LLRGHLRLLQLGLLCGHLRLHLFELGLSLRCLVLRVLGCLRLVDLSLLLGRLICPPLLLAMVDRSGSPCDDCSGRNRSNNAPAGPPYSSSHRLISCLVLF
jgi:hypothetical protein